MAEPLDTRLKRIGFRCWHRGTREADLFLGRFADAHLGTLSEAQLDRFEALIENDDPDVFNWVTGREPVPPAFDNDVTKLLQNFTQATAKR